MSCDSESDLGPIAAYMKADHDRIEELRRYGAWREFRIGVLRHIHLEERILLPAVRLWRGGAPLPEAAKLRDEHTAIATLLVVSPSAEIRAALGRILVPHHALEEAPGGLYDSCDALAGTQAATIVEKLRSEPNVALKRQHNSARVRGQVRRILAWAFARQ